MNPLQEAAIHCPYCGESFTILVDGSMQSQEYTEDCEVCCQPMVVVADCSDDDFCRVVVRREDDA